jgi:hypothetical protein
MISSRISVCAAGGCIAHAPTQATSVWGCSTTAEIFDKGHKSFTTQTDHPQCNFSDVVIGSGPAVLRVERQPTGSVPLTPRARAKRLSKAQRR